MYNKSPLKTSENVREANLRNKDFLEVSFGYDAEMAINEAKRCLNCKTKPCVSGCPVNIRIPEFILKVANGEFLEAYDIIKTTSALPAVCGRVCPQETQCEKVCVRGIKGESVGIGRLERFVADYGMAHKNIKSSITEKKNKKVAVIGSGPSGLTCAGDLVTLGYEVTIFEALHTAGGVLVYGIPEFRLPKKLVQQEIQILKDMGVKIMTNTVIGNTFTIDDLKEQGFDAIFIGTGAGLPKFQNIKGENYNGVYSANEFLTRINLMRSYDFPNVDTPINIGEKVVVIGGGNVAIDAVRASIRLQPKTATILYRRSEKEMPARLEEIEHAKEEGVQFKFYTKVKEILADENGFVNAVKCVEMELIDDENGGRRKPIEKQNSDFTIEVDTVIVAIGTTPNPIIKNTTKGLKTYDWGGIVIDENTGQTSVEGVFAGGDIVNGAATVILAMGNGKTAAKSIDKYLCK